VGREGANTQLRIDDVRAIVRNITTFAPEVAEAVEKRVSAADANRNFSRFLEGVRRGKSYVVTSHGKPVAKLIPFEKSEGAKSDAWEALFSRLRDQPVQDIGPWTRDELYEDPQ
jgi:prevent-host-death family protein